MENHGTCPRCGATIVGKVTGPETALEDEIERLRDALWEITQWAKAYPLTVFPEPDWDKARELLAGGGITLDRISASNMRHVINGVGKIAQDALANGLKSSE